MKQPEVVYLHRSRNRPSVAPPKRELRCFCCGLRAEPGAVGWESNESDDRCPKHRRERPPAIATLGELIRARQEKR